MTPDAVPGDAPEGGLAPEDQALFDKLATWLCERRLETPAVLFLETARPLSFVGSQAMHFFEPFARALFVPPEYDRLAKLFERRENLELLIRTIENEADRKQARGKGAR
jgi:hypothetical protein